MPRSQTRRRQSLHLRAGPRATASELGAAENRIVDLRRNWGINVVAGSGNSGGTQSGIRRASPLAVAVGASDLAGALCQFSNHGPEIDLIALGCRVEISWPGGGLRSGNGTATRRLQLWRSSLPFGPTPDDECRVWRRRSSLTSARATSSGLRVDAAAAFRLAGLGRLVESADGALSVRRRRPVASWRRRQAGVGGPRCVSLALVHRAFAPRPYAGRPFGSRQRCAGFR